MRIELTDNSYVAAWNAYLQGKPESSLYHRYEWREFFAGYFTKETLYLAALDDGDAIRGVLPLVRLKSRLFGDFFVSLPYVNYGGVVADTTEIARSLMIEATSLGAERGVSHIELRHAGQDFDLPCRQEKVAMLLDLPASLGALSKAIGAKRRSQIKRPLRENPDIRIGTYELLDEFYSVFSRNMRDLGTPVYAKSMFRYLLDKMPESTLIVAISVAGRPAAAAFLLFNDERMEIPWASTVREFNKVSINMLLYWEVLKLAIERGHKVFDFGRSTVDSGTYRFKKQWGAEPMQLKWHYWLADGVEMPQLNPANVKYRLAIETWKRLPLPLANLLGPQIVRHLP